MAVLGLLLAGMLRCTPEAALAAVKNSGTVDLQEDDKNSGAGSDEDETTGNEEPDTPTDVKPAGSKTVSLYLGQKFTFGDNAEGELMAEKPEIVSFSAKNEIRAKAVGSTKVYQTTEKGKALYAVVYVKENELLSGLSFDGEDYSGKVAGTGSFRIYAPAFDGMACRYTSSQPAVASVDNSGNVTPVGGGSTAIQIEVTDKYGGTYYFHVTIRVLQPHFENTKMNLALGCTATLPFLDAGGYELSCTSSKASVVSVEYSDTAGVTVRAKKKGTALITASLNGVTATCKISVTNPKLNKEYGFYRKNNKIYLKLTGLNAASSPVWSTENNKIGTVSASGVVRTKKMGSTVIHCDVDGKTLSFYLAVSTYKAVKAMRYGYKQLGKKKYSQARRMSRNYYDCSSFVYRSYRAAGKILVRRASWAPVAAEIASYYVRKGKRVKTAGKTYSWDKLRPGDLICFGGPAAPRNGRYQRIYHIAIYIGNGKTMESSSTYNNVVIRDREVFTKKGVPVIVRPA